MASSRRYVLHPCPACEGHLLLVAAHLAEPGLLAKTYLCYDPGCSAVCITSEPVMHAPRVRARGNDNEQMRAA